MDRPVMRYHGGKWRLAKWIISYFPPHRIYVEPYGGAASVLLQKSMSYAEIYNDLDDNIVNVFRILRDTEKAKKLLKLIELTPFSRQEFYDSYLDTDDNIERARRTIVRSFMGYSSDSATKLYTHTGFRNNNRKSGTFASVDWSNYPMGLKKIIKRFKCVVIEKLPAIEIINIYDDNETLFYLDPPYLKSTRFDGDQTKCYNFEMTEDQHIELLQKIKNINGMAIISSYWCELYEKYLSEWCLKKKETYGQAGHRRGSKINVECLWISPKAQSRIKQLKFDYGYLG